jgi:glycosyltransferase involved in cell wall biosynthesis
LATPKVLLIIGTSANRIGGLELFVHETGLQLRDRGVETIAAFNAEPTAAVQRYLASAGVTIEPLEDLTDGTWHENTGVRSLLKKYRPKIVHWHFLNALSPYPWLSWWYGAKQVFFTNHASYPEGYSPTPVPVWKRLTARLINFHLTGIICPSEYAKNATAASGKLAASRIHRIYNAASLPSLKDTTERSQKFRRTYGIPENAPVVLQVSWLIPEKGLEDLLQAAKLVFAQYPEARFVITGEGRDEAKLKNLAADLGIAKSVIWTGFLESPTESGLYDAADIVCQLSRWEETFGYVNTEAMSFAKPVVATSVGGIPEVVTHEKTGLLSPRRDPRSAAQNICRLLADPALRRKFGEAGRQRVEETFLIVDRVREMLRYYDVPPLQ